MITQMTRADWFVTPKQAPLRVAKRGLWDLRRPALSRSIVVEYGAGAAAFADGGVGGVAQHHVERLVRLDGRVAEHRYDNRLGGLTWRECQRAADGEEI